MNTKPTRRDLLIVIGHLQSLIGQAGSAFHDRNPNRQAEVNAALADAVSLCIRARSFDPPIMRPRGAWAKLPESKRSRV